MLMKTVPWVMSYCWLCNKKSLSHVCPTSLKCSEHFFSFPLAFFVRLCPCTSLVGTVNLRAPLPTAFFWILSDFWKLSSFIGLSGFRNAFAVFVVCPGYRLLYWWLNLVSCLHLTCASSFFLPPAFRESVRESSFTGCSTTGLFSALPVPSHSASLLLETPGFCKDTQNF